MALFDKKRVKQNEQMEEVLTNYFKMFNAYSPKFRTFDGGVYEMELTRACIHSFANHVSKAKPYVMGQNNNRINRTLNYKPNPLMDTSKYLYRLATIFEIKNNVIIAPLFDEMRQSVVGFYPVHPDKGMIKSDKNGNAWLEYSFEPNLKRIVKLSECGIVTQHQNKDELWGEGNSALLPTLQLMSAQNQAIQEGMKNSAQIKFLAKLSQSLKPEDVTKERDRFARANFQNNDSSVLMIDAKYADVKQLTSNQFTIDDKQMALIRENVFDYFGVSSEILQNKYSSEQWNAYYEGKIEPFLNKIGLAHTNMLFSDHEIAFGNEVVFSSNRMNYLNIGEKVTTVQTLFDRGMLTQSEGREILNLPPIEGGNAYFIRKEYVEAYETQNEPTEAQEGEQNDDTNGQN